MTGIHAAPFTAASVVDDVKHVWYVAADIIPGDSSHLGFGGISSKSAQMLREQEIWRTQAHLHIEQAAMAAVNAAPVTAVRVVRIKHVWYVAVGVIAGGRSTRGYRVTLSESATKC